MASSSWLTRVWAVPCGQPQNGRGLMEVARQCLAVRAFRLRCRALSRPARSISFVHRPLGCVDQIAGKFPGADYEDIRVGEGATPMDQVKDTLDANLGRMPICEADGVSIGQGPAIHMFIAATHGLCGSGAAEMAQILSIKEALGELDTAFRGLVKYGDDPTEEALSKFFEDSTSSDYTGMANGAGRPTRFLKWYMGRLEGIVGDGGVAVGSSISLADVLIYNNFAECLTKEEAPDMPDWKRAPYNDAARMEAALAGCPKIKAICDAVAANEGMKKWLAMRGPQGF